MTVKPAIYRPPPKEERGLPETFTTYPTGDANDPHRMQIRIEPYMGRIVEFSIQQEIEVENRWLPVARIDSCGTGTVHRHQFTRSGRDILNHDPIMVIPVDDGWQHVGKGYLIALKLMHDEYEDNLRRWDRD